MLAAAYVINYLLFRLFFDYAFMQGAPVYVASLDPHGLFNANLALVFYITFNSIMFLVINFELWPFTLSASLMRQLFPFLIFYAEFLQFWQLRKHDSHVAVNGV
jgi:hypothetical protein